MIRRQTWKTNGVRTGVTIVSHIYVEHEAEVLITRRVDRDVSWPNVDTRPAFPPRVRTVYPPARPALAVVSKSSIRRA